MPRLTSGVLGFPDFRGFTRALILWNLVAYFVLLILGAFARPIYEIIMVHLTLVPSYVLHQGWVWQVGTYWIIHAGIWNTAFELLSIWFLAAFLESTHGSRWVAEIFFLSVLGAALVALAIAAVFPTTEMPLYGCYGGIFGLLIVFGVLYADMEFMMLPLPFMIKAKYLVAVYMLITLAMLFSAEKAFAFSQLGGALFAWLYIKFAPRRGFATASSESWFGMRNRYYRWKRRRASKKFEVYMRKHNDKQ